MRVHGGEVESLTAATQTRRRRPRLDRPPGRLRLRHRPLRGGRRRDRRPRRGGGRGRRRGRVRGAAGSRPRSRRSPGLSDPSVAEWDDRAGGRARARRSSAPRSPSDPRLVGVEHAVYADSAEQVAIASSTGVAGEYESSSCLRLPAGAGRGRRGARDRPRLRPRPRPATASTRRRSAPRRAERALAMIGAGKPASRSCPVVLDQTVAASFAGLIGGAPRRQRRAARPLALRRAASARSSPARPSPSTTTAATPQGPASAPFDGEGVPRRRTRADRGRPPARLPLRHLHRQPRGRRLDRLGGPPAATARCPRSRPRTWSSPPARSRSRSCWPRPATGVYVTDVAGLHSGVNPVTGVFSVGASGPRSIRGGELAEPVREFTIAGDLVAMLSAVQRRRSGGPLGPVRRLGQHAAAADRRDGDQRLVTFGSRQREFLRRSHC